MHSQKLTKSMLLLSSIFVLSTTSGCSLRQPEKQVTNVLPKLESLSAETLQAMQPNSTELLKKADIWYENSGKLLDSVTNK